MKDLNQSLKRIMPSLGVYEKLNIAKFNPLEKLFMKDASKVKEKISNMKLKSRSFGSFQVVSDFDFTITCSENKTPSSMGVFMRNKSHPELNGFKNALKTHCQNFNLFNEKGELSINEKKSLLLIFIIQNFWVEASYDWFNQLEKIFLESEITKQTYQSLLNNANVQIRNGFDKYIKLCCLLNIPFYVVSAGFVNVISSIFDSFMPKMQEEYSNLFLFGNEMIFENNKLKKFDLNVLPFEKNIVLKSYQKMVNTIVVGDALFDLQLADNFSNQQYVLKIGYFNNDPQKEQQLFEKYLNSYDVVITNDGNFQFVELITRYLIQEDLFKSIMENQKELNDHYNSYFKVLI